MTEQIKINWYRSSIDKKVMSELMKKSDLRGFAQVIPQLALFAATGTLAWLCFRIINADNWAWSVPVLLAALFLHGTFANFFGGTACHELCHKTPFQSAGWNEFFLRIYAFLSWFDPATYRLSHVKHHQVTVHEEHDGEVVLPLGLDWHGVKFICKAITFDPVHIWKLLRSWVAAACGDPTRNAFFSEEWTTKLFSDAKEDRKREHRNWARFVLFGHLALAALFIATGNWILIVIVTFGCQYSYWLQLLCGAPQHVGLCPNVPDFRLCCRTYTCSWFPAFLYWNMQYHVEHHMFPAVPFYNLPKLRKAIEHDLPPAPHGLLATWKEIIPILQKQRKDQSYQFVPRLPNHQGERVEDAILQAEAAQA